MMSAATQMARGLIEIKPEVMMGKPVIAGTRITVEVILEKLAAGETIEQIVADLGAAAFDAAAVRSIRLLTASSGFASKRFRSSARPRTIPAMASVPAFPTDGKWLLLTDKKLYPSLHKLSWAVVNRHENSWYNWKYRTDNGAEHFIHNLRDVTKVPTRS